MSCGKGEVTSPEDSLSAGPDKGAMEPADDEESPELSKERLIQEFSSIRARRKRQVEKIGDGI
jgi:hypothetical protein